MRKPHCTFLWEPLRYEIQLPIPFVKRDWLVLEGGVPDFLFKEWFYPHYHKQIYGSGYKINVGFTLFNYGVNFMYRRKIGMY